MAIGQIGQSYNSVKVRTPYPNTVIHVCMLFIVTFYGTGIWQSRQYEIRECILKLKKLCILKSTKYRVTKISLGSVQISDDSLFILEPVNLDLRLNCC